MKTRTSLLRFKVDMKLRLLSWIVFCFASTATNSFCQAQEAINASERDARQEYLDYAAQHHGDVERGKSLFNHPEKALCSKCHLLNGMERSGPNLDGIADKYPREQLARQVLYPNEFIAQGFEQVKILTKDGNVLAGRMERSNQIEVKLVDAQGKFNNVKRKDIEEIKEVATSFMPADLEKSLSHVEFADLMAYLKTLKYALHEGYADGGRKVSIPALSPSVKVEPIHPPELNFENPVWCGALPGTANDLLVVEHMTRRVWRLIRDEGPIRKELFLELGKEVHTGANQGLMCITFHPDFVRNRRYFLEYEVQEDGQVKTTVAERKATIDGLKDSGEPSIRLLETFQPAGNHNGGCIDFGTDGMLYAAFGDGGPQKDPNGYSQNPRILLGSMLRIDVDHRDAGLTYSIPKDNPFWEAHRLDPMVRAETWAIGFREPWRFSFDPKTGELYVGDVGQDKLEEVAIVRRGENHGWNVKEAFIPFSNEYARQGEKYQDPVFAYPHGLGFSITGGYVYRGSRSPSYDGVYIFGDYNTRLIWGLRQRDGKLDCVYQIGNAPNGIASFGTDQRGEIYLVTYKGVIYHIDLSESEYPSKTEKADDQPWETLFNGTDYSGWKIVAHSDPAPAIVEEGAMVLRQRTNTVEHTFVTSEKKYGDFILELDLKDDPGFNSGILLRCQDAAADAAVRLNGYQVKIDNTKRSWTGGIFDDFGNSWRWLFDLKDDARARDAFKLGEWSHFRIECIGSTIKVWVNDVPTCHLIDEKYGEGYIAMKIHSLGNNPKATEHAIRLKNIRILADHPERFVKPMELEARRAPTDPGAFDKAAPVQ
jgi:putative heme-binding domain-containing protein